MNRYYSLPCIDRYGEVLMGLINRPVTLAGSIGKLQVTALFDNGASYSCISRAAAIRIAHLEKLPEPMEFETAEKGGVIKAQYRINTDFFFQDTNRRFSDELIVMDSLSEELIIGAATMQKWKIRLDFEREEVLYEKQMHRLRI
jgi:hypothetical protein